MGTCNYRFLAIGLVLLIATPDAIPLWAATGSDQPEEEKAWSDKAEVTYLATSGNAKAETLGFRNTLIRHWVKGQATLEAGAVRAEDTRKTRSAVLEPSGLIRVRENSSTELTAESLFLRGRYDRNFSARLFWFVGMGWERNEFAGIKKRISSVGGIGHEWYEKEGQFFRTDLGVTYTEEEDVAGGSMTFSGGRAAWSLVDRWTETTEFQSDLKLDQNLEDSSDIRADLTSSVAVRVNSRIAIKLSLQMLFDHQPAFELVEVTTDDGVPTGDSIPVELDELDSIFNASVIVTF